MAVKKETRSNKSVKKAMVTLATVGKETLNFAGDLVQDADTAL